MATKSVAYKHLNRALSQWPKDILRPECQFQDVMMRRLSKIQGDAASSPAAAESHSSKSVNGGGISELEQANILYSLLDGRYQKKYPVAGTLMTPLSNPTHYTDLIRDIEAVPTRGTWTQISNKLKGLLRFS